MLANKQANKARERRRQTTCSLKGRRIGSKAMYNLDWNMFGTLASISVELGRHLQLVFATRGIDAHIQESVLDFVASHASASE